ncbi:MAG: TetR/AcrR family transcriptional regulator [Gemmatimonadota bacterium]
MSESRARILDCACELYLEDGFEGFSMRKVARSVGVTAPALYRHYESKEHLLMDVVGEAHNVLGQYLHTSLEGATPHDRFQRAGTAYLDFALDHPRYFQVMSTFAEFMGLDEMPEELAERSCAVQRFWDDRVRECVEAGVLRRDAPEAIGLTLWSHAFGLISLYLLGLLSVSEEVFRTLYHDSFERVLCGLGGDLLVERIDARRSAASDEEVQA